jgi:hypothetical protein
MPFADRTAVGSSCISRVTADRGVGEAKRCRSIVTGFFQRGASAGYRLKVRPLTQEALQTAP